MNKEITSRENQEVRHYTLLLASRKERVQSGLFVTEGFKLTQEAMQAGCACQAVYATSTAIKKYAVESLFAECSVVADNVAEKMAASVTPQGVFGVFTLPQPRIPEILPTGRYLLLDGLQDPGNVGTILRTGAALGLSGVFLSPDSPDPFSMKVLRASMGGVFRLPLQIAESTETIAQLREAGLPVWAAALTGNAVSLRGLQSQPCGVVIGNEGAGLPQELITSCDGTVMIPMVPGNESLNAAMAAGILIWEITK